MEGRAFDPAGGVLELHRPAFVPGTPEEEPLPDLCAGDLLARNRDPARRGERVSGEEYLGDGCQSGQRDLGFGEGLPEDEPRALN